MMLEVVLGHRTYVYSGDCTSVTPVGKTVVHVHDHLNVEGPH